jgi:transcription termination factor Rho
MEEVNLRSKKLKDLRYIAKVMGIKSITKYRKNELIEKILELGRHAPDDSYIKPAEEEPEKAVQKSLKEEKDDKTAEITVDTPETEADVTQHEKEVEEPKRTKRGRPSKVKEEDKVVEKVEDVKVAAEEKEDNFRSLKSRNHRAILLAHPQPDHHFLSSQNCYSNHLVFVGHKFSL